MARNTYFVIGLGYVAYSFIGTLNKVIDDRIVVSITENEFQRFTFPSITFCYPFNQQVGKDIKNIVKKLQNNPGNLRSTFDTKLAILHAKLRYVKTFFDLYFSWKMEFS